MHETIPAQLVGLAVKRAFAIAPKHSRRSESLDSSKICILFDTISEATAPVKLQIIHFSLT